MVFRAQGASIVAFGVAVILLVVTVAIAVALPADIRAQFTVFEMLTLGALLGATLGGLYAVPRSFVRIGDDLLHIRNGFRDHRIPWGAIAGVSFRTGAPWPTLVTYEGDRIQLFAVQGTDGDKAQRAVDAIRARLS